MEENQGNKIAEPSIIEEKREIELADAIEKNEILEKEETPQKDPSAIEKIENAPQKEPEAAKNVRNILENNEESERKKLILSYDTEENRETLKKKLAEYFNTDFINNYEEKNNLFYRDVEEIKISFHYIAVEAESIKIQYQSRPSTSTTATHKYTKTELHGSKNDSFYPKKTSVNESFLSIKNSAQKEKKFEKIKPNTLTKSVDIDREGLRSNKLNFNTVRNHADTGHYNVNLYNTIDEKQRAEVSTPKKSSKSKNLLSAINSKTNTVTKEKEKEKEKEEEHDKTPHDKAKIMDKLKTTAKIKRPVISLKPNANANSKVNTTGYETNVTSSSKSPLASNFPSERPNIKTEKKPKESKDDSSLKHKRPLENQPETGKLDKTHRLEKKTNSNKILEEDAEAKNLVNNLAAKKSSNKIPTTSSHPTSKKTSEKQQANGDKLHNAEANDNSKVKKDNDKAVDKSKTHDKLKDKKETKTSSKLASTSTNKLKTPDAKSTKETSKKETHEEKKEESLPTESNKEINLADNTPDSAVTNRIESDNNPEKTTDIKEISSEDINENKKNEPLKSEENISENLSNLDEKILSERADAPVSVKDDQKNKAQESELQVEGPPHVLENKESK